MGLFPPEASSVATYKSPSDRSRLATRLRFPDGMRSRTCSGVHAFRIGFRDQFIGSNLRSGISTIHLDAPDADVVQAMDHRLATIEGRAVYALRKSTVEPVFGIIKSVLGFRQFHLRGLAGASGEWTLVTTAWNLKRLFNLKSAADRTIAAACLKASNTHRKRSIGNSPRSISAAGMSLNSANNSRQIPWREFLRAMFTFCDFETHSAGLSPTGC